ncbi:MAG: hypothetical protein RBS27_12765 [Giesbergeria sp.]|jgi:hypothetical protein|nr:hypothetical protein [Giesbergeria sp.]
MTWARTLMTLAAASLVATGALAMDRTEYNTARQRIVADAQVRMDKCRALTANARDVCRTEARGFERIARAELEALYRPSEQAHFRARVVRADAAHAAARQKCNDLAGPARKVCQKDAKGVHVRAVEDAKVAQVQARPGDTPAAKNAAVAEALKHATAERRKADFAAARERCGTLAADLQARCVADARRVYSQ